MSFNHQLSAILNEVHEAVAVCDLLGNFVFLNNAWNELPEQLQHFSQAKLLSQVEGKFYSTNTAEFVSIQGFEDTFIAIVHRETQQIVLKNDVLTALLNATLQNKDIFIESAKALGNILKWRWVVLTHFVSQEQIEVLAFWDKDHLEKNFNYPLIHTPCKKVFQNQQFIRINSLAQEYPDDEMVIDLGAIVYAGFVYKNKAQQVIGHIYLMHDTAQVDWQLAEEALHMVSTIVGTQLTLDQTEKEMLAHKELALTDALTHISNRLAFDKDLEQVMNQCSLSAKEHFMLAMIDLDGMKQINDTLGHDGGDRLLKCFAEQLTKMGREQDHAYRFGGDEFAFIFRFVGVSQKDLLKERFGHVVEQVKNNGFSKIGASIGLASSQEVQGNICELIKLADKRMYIDKKKNKSQSV